MAMKALVKNAQKKKTEAFELIKKSLFLNMKSFTCWHIFGLLYRSDRNYDEARKCYLHALKHDKDNLNVTRDLALLQVQLRDTEGFEETRRQMLLMKPNVNNHWLGYAVAAHVNKNHQKALSVLKSFKETAGDSMKRLEKSEILLYEATIMEECQKF
jgi:tetratricopeptide (TPR) repeat protein